MNQFVSLVMAVGLFVVAGSVSLGESSGPDKVLLVTAADRTDPQLRDTIAEFSALGYHVTNRPDAALRASQSEDLTVFMVTRRAFDAVPDATLGDMYGRGVVIGGLNVSRSELRREPAPRGLQYTPERAIFSFTYWSRDCSSGSTSDWLRNWNLPSIISMKLEQIRACMSD